MTENRIFKKMTSEVNDKIEFFKIGTGKKDTGLPGYYYRGRDSKTHSAQGWIEIMQIDDVAHIGDLSTIKIPYNLSRLNSLNKCYKLGFKIFLLLRLNGELNLVKGPFDLKYRFIDFYWKRVWKGKTFFRDDDFIDCLMSSYYGK
jgi:hypothetical protein